MDKKETLKIIKDFVEGKLPINTFKDICKTNHDFRENIKEYRHLSIGEKYDNKIINMVDYYNWNSYNNQFKIQFVFVRLLISEKITNFKYSTIYEDKAREFADLIPDWLSDDAMTYVDEEIIDKVPEELNEKDKKKWIKQRIKETFKYEKKPPEFAQEGVWPQDEDGNFLVFRKQKQKGELVTYTFVNPKTKEEVEFQELY